MRLELELLHDRNKDRSDHQSRKGRKEPPSEHELPEGELQMVVPGGREAKDGDHRQENQRQHEHESKAFCDVREINFFHSLSPFKGFRGSYTPWLKF